MARLRPSEMSSAPFCRRVMWRSLPVRVLRTVEHQPRAIGVCQPFVRQKFDRPLLRLDRRVEVAGLGLRGGERIKNARVFPVCQRAGRVANWTAFLPSRNFASGQAAISIALALYAFGSAGWSRMASAK